MPLKIEAIMADPIQARERSVKFLAQILGLTGSVALDKPIAVSMPLAEDIDRVVERSAIDGRQEPRLQDPIDEPLTRVADHGLFGCR